MSKNTTQARFIWYVLEVPLWNRPDEFEVEKMRRFPGRLPDNKRIVGRFDDCRMAQLFAKALPEKAPPDVRPV